MDAEPGPAGIIPAYAGSTVNRVGHWVGLPDHPRIRGEHKDHGARVAFFEGSSPHTRGALGFGGVEIDAAGIIPPYAGSTCRSPRRRPAPWDHPRIRGEHAACSNASRDDRGSSPHTRGARPASGPDCGGGRIIPAYAGSTSPRPRARPRVPDHPRIRGEHLGVGMDLLGGRGSSPHTRGARHPGGGVVVV